jgi:PAS domain S-box-containing protein
VENPTVGGAPVPPSEASASVDLAARRLTGVADSSDVAIISVGLDGLVQTWNREAERLLGYAADEVVGQSLSLLAPPGDDAFSVVLSRLASGESIERQELIRVRKDGNPVLLSVSVWPRRDDRGRVVGASMVARDVSEKRWGGESLQRLAAVVETSPDAIVSLSTEGVVVGWNPAAERIYGYAARQVLGRSLLQLPAEPEEQRLDLAAILDRVTGGETVHGFETRRVSRDGSAIDISLTVTPIRDSQGHVNTVSLVAHDITDRKRAQDEARRLAAILASTDDAIIGTDLAGNIESWNPGAERMFGWEATETIGRPITLITPPDARQAASELLERVRNGDGVERLESTGRHKEGEHLDVSVTASPVFDGEGRVVGVARILRDVTARKAAEAQRVEAEERFRLMSETVSDIVWSLIIRDDLSVEVEWVGGEDFAAESGYTMEEFQTAGGWLALIHPDDVDQVAQDMSRLLNGERVDTEFRVLTGSGELRWWQSSARALPEDGNGHRRVVGGAKDVTARKLAEEALAATRVELERHAAELERSNKDLERFAYFASHDLQEPLRMVASYTQLLAQRYSGSLDADADTFIDFALDGAQRMQALIHDLLVYSRAAREPRSQPVGLDICLGRALANLKVALAESDAVVRSENLPTVTGDPGALTQVFQNLVGNALKFRGAYPPEVEVRAERVGPEWLIWVRDNGIGIAPEHAERVFQLFQRLHRDECPGTGIGLALCRKIVERLGGRIWVESDPGEGATFFFTLPGPPAEEAKPGLPAEEANHGEVDSDEN